MVKTAYNMHSLKKKLEEYENSLCQEMYGVFCLGLFVCLDETMKI